MRVIYSDETGVGGSITEEPITLVAAIMLNMDSQWHPVKDAIEKLLSSLMRSERARSYQLKGKRLFSEISRGNVAVRDTAKEILAGSLKALVEHKVPIFYGAVSRVGYLQALNFITDGKRKTGQIHKLSGETQAAAFYTCASHVDMFMHTGFPSEQVLWIAAKSRADAELKTGLTDLRAITAVGINKLAGIELFRETSHLIHIADAIYFGEMQESRALQLADLCCSVIVRALNGDRLARGYWDQIRLNLMSPTPPLLAGRGMIRKAMRTVLSAPRGLPS